MGKALNLKFNFVSSPKFLYLFIFSVALILRGIPELLVYWYPVGYETITFYAPPMFTFYRVGLVDVFFQFFNMGPLFYVLMWIVQVSIRAQPYIILKVFGPLLYGGLAVSFLFFLKNGLKLEKKMAFVAALLMIVQVATLRESWDRSRTILGLIFVFAALSSLKSNSKYKWPLVTSLSILTVLSREYIAFVLFVAILGFAILQKKDRVTSLAALAPALAIFGLMFAPTVWGGYLSPENPLVVKNYLWAVQDVLSIFVICYLPLLIFVLKGWKRDRLFDPVLGWLFLGSFSVIVIPWMAIPGYQRWLMLLVYPFTVYAIRGFERFHLFEKTGLRKLVAIMLVFSIIGVGYSSGSFSYVSLPNSWMPTNLVQSTIPWSQTDDVKVALDWLNENAETNSSILVEERFYGWTLIYLKRANDDVKVISYYHNFSPQTALEKALDDGFSEIFLIWYADSNIKDFKIIFSRNNIAILQYQSYANST